MDKKEILFRMKRIRSVEEGIAERYKNQLIRCPTHLSIGQEAVAVITGILLSKEDYVVSTHRSHAHYLGKGGDLNAMLAELYGKAAGCSKGRGGSMHLIDKSVNFIGSTAIVGNTIPIGVGLGLACQLESLDRISCIFLGDGAVEEGAFYEAVNFCAVKKLPVLFVCENNLYSVYSPLKVRQPDGRKIYKMVAGMGVTSASADGNNIYESYYMLKDVISNVRNGNGPAFVEFSTYRWREHCGPNYDNDIGYRTEAEYLQWKNRDAIETFSKRLMEEGYLDADDIAKMDKEIEEEVSKSFYFAENAPFPCSKEAFVDEYCTRNI